MLITFNYCLPLNIEWAHLVLGLAILPGFVSIRRARTTCHAAVKRSPIFFCPKTVTI